ncbi:MAG: rRNA maturation RNase YbeY [Pseudomonadota bacterium]|jgi:probable rRNA maturation factor|nr:MAG: rRNA maturation RNase YbeY [Pseudomonadota bacterium]
MRPRPPLIVECRIPPRTKAPPARLMARWAEAALGSRGAGHEMAVQVVSPARMRVLNRRYRGKDRPTNVLAFPAQDTGRVRPKPLGDVVICAAVLRREARAQGKREVAHWAHLVVHGTLHLAGHDHENESDAARMERREIAVLRKLGFGNPYTVTEVAARRRTRKRNGRGRRQ